MPLAGAPEAVPRHPRTNAGALRALYAMWSVGQEWMATRSARRAVVSLVFSVPVDLVGDGQCTVSAPCIDAHFAFVFGVPVPSRATSTFVVALLCRHVVVLLLAVSDGVIYRFGLADCGADEDYRRFPFDVGDGDPLLKQCRSVSVDCVVV